MSANQSGGATQDFEPRAGDRDGFLANLLNVLSGLGLLTATVVTDAGGIERVDVVVVGLLLAFIGSYNLLRVYRGRFEHPDGLRLGLLLGLWLAASTLHYDPIPFAGLTDAALAFGVVVLAVNSIEFGRQFRGRPEKRSWARNHGFTFLDPVTAAGIRVHRSLDGMGERVVEVVTRDAFQLNLIAIVIGVIAGIGAVVFRLTIFAFQELFFGAAINPGSVSFAPFDIPNVFGLTAVLGPARYLLIPAAGGLAVGLFITYTTTAVRGHGVPEVLESLLTENGRIDPKITVYKTIASSIAIGSGASLGREGPIVQIGSAGGSYFGKYVNSRYTRTLVAAGAGAGIAATFNTPLAGIMFALEILLAEYYLQNVVVVVLASVTATAVARSILGFTAAPGVHEFLVPIHYKLVTPVVEFPLYVLLGLVVAIVGAGVVKLLYATEHLFENRLDLPAAAKPAIGGGLLGLSVLVTALVTHGSPFESANWLFGVGYQSIQRSISGEFALSLLVLLAIMKAVGFSMSVGSGSSGGVFSPSLYVGAMVGGAFGILVNDVFAGTAGAGAYALVGTAGVFAATASAPLTATLVIFELTGQYTVILPLLVVTVVGSQIGQVILNRGTIYTEKLRDKGITVQERRIGSLEDLTAEDVMTTDVDTITTDATVEDALDAFQANSHRGLPIVDEDDRVVGILVRSDLANVLSLPDDADDSNVLANGGELMVTAEATVEDVTPETPVEEIAEMDVFTASPHTNLLTLVDRMVRADIGRVPIVTGDGTLEGIVTRTDILAAYDQVPYEECANGRQGPLAD